MKNHENEQDDVEVVCDPEDPEGIASGVLDGEHVHQHHHHSQEDASESGDGPPGPVVELGQFVRTETKGSW